MNEVYESLTKDLSDCFRAEDTEMALVILLAMQEIRLYLNYSKEAWIEEDIRKMLRDIVTDFQLQDA